MFARRTVLLALALSCLFVAPALADAVSDGCETCHRENEPGIYRQWQGSAHGEAGVTCLDCHGAETADADAFEHHDATIATLVTPLDCGECHEQESEQTRNSYHASAGKILDSKDAYLAHVAGGEPAAVAGCESCHGGVVQIDPTQPNMLSKKSWPNSGIGRVNPDGSTGSCTACHTRHSFDIAQARQPAACSKCHLGPDHPQKEVYEESKHGNAYFTNVDEMNLDSDEWVVGVDYDAAPTCATCHMSATREQGVTHNVGDRIAWTLRPIVSKHKDNWEQKREAMSDVCGACHTDTFADGHFYQFDAAVRLYNEKFAIPAKAIMDKVKERGLLERPASFSNEIEWEFWELWHHEGRRARHGAAMMGPDYTWWHGFYDVAHNFYFKFIPSAEHFGDAEVNALIDELIYQDPMHDWVNKDTASLKAGINDGTFQQRFAHMFEKYVEEEAAGGH
jgi:formate-dependent nitrite reductase cytochrome c552 subunit